MTYLGLPVLIIVLGLSRRRYTGRGLALTMIAGGCLLAMGPWLASGNALVEWGGRNIPLPALALESLGYPTSANGMYYRAIQIAGLGMALAIAGGAGSGGKAMVLAWVLGMGQVYDGWRVTDLLWPRQATALEGAALLQEMAEDSTPGAVLDLPLDTEPYVGGRYMLAAAVHGRSTNGLPRQNRVAHLPHLARLDRALDTDPEILEQRLADLGFRYVVWHRMHDRDANRKNLLEAALGAGQEADGIAVWTVDP